MQLPGVNASSHTYLSFAYHVEGAVEAWVDAEIITAAQQQAVLEVGALIASPVTALRAASNAADDAERAATKALARFRVRDVILDMRVMGASDALLNGPALRNRQSLVYKEVFAGDNAGDITRARMREEPEIAKLLASRLAAIDDFDGKATAHANLADAVQKSIAARDASDAAAHAANEAGNVELSARLALRIALDKAYSMLRLAFPGGRDFVESFFPRAERAAKSTPAATEPQEGAGG